MAQIRFIGNLQLGARMEDLDIGFSLLRPLLCLLQLRTQRIWDMETQATQIVTCRACRKHEKAELVSFFSLVI